MQEYFSVEELLDEVKDSAARKWFDLIPFDIKYREPTPEAIKVGKQGHPCFVLECETRRCLYCFPSLGICPENW